MPGRSRGGGTAPRPQVPGDCWSSSAGTLGLYSFTLGVLPSSWTETWTPGSRTREARLALPREVQASCPGSWVHALWDPPASLQSPRWLCWVFLFIPSSACQPPSLAPLSAQSSPALRGHTQAGTRGVGPGAEEAAALLLDPGWAPGGCPPTSGSPEDPGSTEALWPGPCTCLEGVSDWNLAFAVSLCAGPEGRVCTVCWVQPCREPGRQNLGRLKRCPVWL